MKTTQLYRKRHHDVNSSRCYTFRENFMEDKLTVLCCEIRETFTALALFVGVIFRENWLRLKINFFVNFVEFSFHQFVDKHAVYVQRKIFHLILPVKVRDKVQNVLDIQYLINPIPLFYCKCDSVHNEKNC